MTIPVSYATLKTAIAERRERVGDSAFEALTPDFIAYAEAHLNRLAPVRLSEVNTTLTATPSSRTIAMPSDFLEPIGLWMTTYGDERKMALMTAGSMAVSSTNGIPSYWVVDGSNVAFDCPADSAHTFRFRYRKKLFDLATTDPNWLLTNHPDVYLYASLVEAADHEMDQAASSYYTVRRDRAVDDVRWLEARSKVAPLRVDPALVAAPAFDITSGE